MSQFLHFISLQNKIQTYLKAKEKSEHSIYIYNSTSNMNYALAAAEFYKNKETVVFVAQNPYKATQAYEYLSHLLGFEHVHLYAVDELLSAELLSTSQEFRIERMSAVKSVLENKQKVIVTHPYALLKPISTKETLLNNIIKIEAGKEYDISD